MYKTINGWTKAKMIERIKQKNDGRGPCQQWKNLPKAGNCRYRRSDGNCCLVGVFIPDDEYSAQMEGMGVVTLLKEFPLLNKHMPLDSQGMNVLQGKHDLLEDLDTDIHELATDWINRNVEDSNG
jgi:hypothetical protein